MQTTDAIFAIKLCVLLSKNFRDLVERVNFITTAEEMSTLLERGAL